MTALDFCPRCRAYASPMVWLGEHKGWICEDCYNKEVKEDANKRDNNCDNMRDNRGYIDN